MLSGTAAGGVRRWERKQVQIKTLEGEFTVTVWATGKPVTTFCYSNYYHYGRGRFTPLTQLNSAVVTVGNNALMSLGL